MIDNVHETSTGRAMVEAEMARQHADARQSIADSRAMAERIADSIRKTGRLALLGMGGSHWVNRTAAFAYRGLGIEVQSEPLSEALFAPLPKRSRTVILTSQSGGSGEIAKYLETSARQEERFGLTLNRDGHLARNAPSLVGAGGVEKAFAATRSILISQALHLAVLSTLGYQMDGALKVLETPPSPSVADAFRALLSAEIVVLSGRNTLQGVAESGALCLMELARLPTYAFENGQLRHGPMELLSSKTGIILLRAPGETSELTATLAKSCADAGCPIVVFDCSGDEPILNVVTIAFDPLSGMAASLAVLPVLQRLLVELAAAHVPALGMPLRSSKITTAL